MMRTIRSLPPRLLALGLVSALSSVAGAAMYFDLGPSEAIYPPQTSPIIFDHELHVRAEEAKGAGLDCDFCHENLESSELSSDRLIPGHEACDLCHEEWIGDEDEPAAVADCARCHGDIAPGAKTASVAKMRIPTPNLKFGHGPHLRAGADCLDCHPNVPKKQLATRDDYPTMDRCVDCHTEALARVQCRTCHLVDHRGKLQTDFPSGELKPQRYHAFAIHDAQFLRDHSTPAKRDRDYCETCHDENDCMKCHDGIGRDQRYHPDAWMAQHGLRAKKDDYRCQSCHRVQSFCLSCHVRSGVATFGTPADPLERRTIRLQDPSDPSSPATGPHPMGPSWLDPTSRNFHGFHAQRNIRACASCHQESSCIQCHGSGFGGRAGPNRAINPHGPDAARLRGSLASKQNARACLKCHSPADPSWR